MVTQKSPGRQSSIRTTERKKRIYENEESLKVLWGKKIKCTNIFIIMCPQEERDKETEMVEICLTCKGNIPPSQEVQSPKQDDAKETHAKTHYNSNTKVKDKERS